MNTMPIVPAPVPGDDAAIIPSVIHVPVLEETVIPPVQVGREGNAERALDIVDNHLPKVSVSLQFGDSTLFFESRFPADQLPAVTEIVTSVLISSGDPDATVSINGVKIELGILRRPPVIDLPNSDPHIAEMIRRNQWAFMLGNARWEIGMTFLFGDERVSFYACIASHLTPVAFITAKKCLITPGYFASYKVL
jgi:hypothetical protein